MPIIYALIAIGEDESRTIVCLYHDKVEAEEAMAQESFWIDQGEYGKEEEGTVLVIEETEIPGTEEDEE